MPAWTERLADGSTETTQKQEEAIVEAGVDWEKQIAERDARIAELEGQMAGTARNAETAESFRDEIAKLKAQGESDRIDFRLQLAGCRNVKASHARQHRPRQRCSSR